MQSGAILHLAILRKLCSASPQSNYLNKFRNFRTVDRHNQRKRSFTINTSRQIFRKYPQSQGELHFVKAKSQALQEKTNSQKKSRIKIQESTNLSGWNVQNEQQLTYQKLLQKNNFTFFKKQLAKARKEQKKYIKPQRQKRFTYCEQDIHSFFKQVNNGNTDIQAKRSLSRKERSKRLKPLLIDQSKTKGNRSNNASIYIGKENFLAEELVFICPSKSLNTNQKRKIHIINDFAKGFSSQLNCKRIC